MHRYLQTSRPLFLFRRPVVFGKECKSCQTTFKLPLLHMEQKCLQSKAHSQEQCFHLTPTNPSTRNSIPVPVHDNARGTIRHSLRAFCTWKSGQIVTYTSLLNCLLKMWDKVTKFSLHRAEMTYSAVERDRHEDAWLSLDHAQSFLPPTYNTH